MLSREDLREEISALELMRPAEGEGSNDEEAQEDASDGADSSLMGAQEDSGEIGDEADGSEERAAQEAVADYRAALSRLMDDGWTMQELQEMIADGEVLRALGQGETLGRAATAYMRRGGQTRRPPKRGVPTFRAPATEDTRDDDPIARMTDAEFAAFSRRAKEAALAGKRIRLG